MGQEFIIKSQKLEDKINQLLPSQGGFQAGVDLSASTQIVPIIDLTESAEGSNFREDLQKAFSHTSATGFNVTNSTVNQVITPGYYRVFGTSNVITNVSGSFTQIFINDGATDKFIFQHVLPANSNFGVTSVRFDFMVFLEAGDTLKIKSSSSNSFIDGATRQIADISGNLVNP